MTYRVLVTDFTWPSTEYETAVLAEVGAELVLAETGSEEELVRLAGEADAVLTCFAHVPARVIAGAPRLQVIGRYGIGVDNIDVAEATRRGIVVTNVPEYCLDEVASHALALILSLARRVCVFDAAIRQGDWSLRTGLPIRRISGSVLGLIGFGRIGRTLARMAQGLGLTVVASEHAGSTESMHAYGVEPLPLDVLVARSDFVSLHAPLTPSTRALIGRELLRKMKPTAYLVNTARGALIDQDALVEALREGWIAGAGLDVVYPEHLPSDHPLLSLPNVLITPHVAFYSESSVRNLAVLASRNVAAVLSGTRPAAIVNPEVLALPRWAHLSKDR